MELSWGKNTYATGVSPDAPPQPISTMANVDADIPKLCCLMYHISQFVLEQFSGPSGECVCSPYETKGSGIRKSPVVVADMRRLGREIQLFEKLRGYGNTSGCPMYMPLLFIVEDSVPVVLGRHLGL